MSRASQLVKLQAEAVAAGEGVAGAKWLCEEWTRMEWESDGGIAFARAYDAEPVGVVTGTDRPHAVRKTRAQRAFDAALEARSAVGGGAAAAGLVLVPTTWKTDLLSVSQDAELLVMTPKSKATRRLACLRRSVGFAARGHTVLRKGFRADVGWMVTLTYRPGCDWASGHMASAMLSMRDWCRMKKIAFRYVWVAEIQDGKRRADGIGRNVIHYHMVVWLPHGVKCPHFDAQGWWPHGMSQSKAPEKVQNPVGYLLHYLKKDKDLSAMPKGARAYGIGGLDFTTRRARRWLGLPSFVQANSDIFDKWTRAVGGGWLSPLGVHYESEFQLVKLGPYSALQRVCTHAKQLEASGPFCWISRAGV